MNRCISFVVLCGLAAFCYAEDRLPQPHYRPQPSDPAWLATVVQFHGHLGPSVVAGARMGMMGCGPWKPKATSMSKSLAKARSPGRPKAASSTACRWRRGYVGKTNASMGPGRPV